MNTRITTPNNVYQPPPDAHHLWPEPLREAPRPDDPFPIGLALRWLIPGLIGMLILLGVYWYLEQRASKQVIFMRSNDTLGVVRADGADARDLAVQGLEGAPFQSMPQWSPNGRLFATTRDEKVMLIEPSSASPITITLSDVSAVVLPSNAWSYDSAFVVGVDFIQESTHLINVAQAQAITVALDIDRAAPIRWNPVRPELLITARGENRRPELRIITPDGQHRAFAPQDNQAARVFGEWSPDGSQIAYVAGARADNLAGTLWVANADGGNVRQIVADGLNSAPVWSPMGNAIFFTRIVTSTSNSSNFTYDLYRVRPDGQEMTRIGAGIPPQSFANQDRRALIDWSPDGQFMFFQSGDAPGQRTISLARPDGANAQILDVDLFDINFARWSPTSRALLLAGDAEAILYWLDRKQSQSFPAGVSYAWQP